MPEICKLVAVLEETLETTNQTKQILQIQCDEIRHLLLDWPVPKSSESIELPDCTCNNNVSVDERDEMDKDIEGVLELAQRLRKEKRLNNNKQRGSNSKVFNKSYNVKIVNSTARSICNTIPRLRGTGRPSDLGSTETKTVVTGRNSGATTINVKKRNLIDTSVKPTSEVKIKSRSLSVPSHSYKSERVCTDKTDIKTRESASLFQTTYQKDFSSHSNLSCRSSLRGNLISKLSNQNIGSEVGRSVVDIGHSNIHNFNNVETGTSINALNHKPSPRTITVSDLDKLLSRVAINTHSRSDLDAHTTTYSGNSCLLHHMQQEMKRPTRFVGLQEAINFIAVPPDLVKILKSYHRYLGELQYGETFPERSKGAASEGAFREQLMKSNNNRWRSASCEPMVSLYSDYLSTFVKAFNIRKCAEKERSTDKELTQIHKKFECLESHFLKLSNLDESALSDSAFTKTIPKTGLSTTTTPTPSCWAVAGLWNEGSKDMFKGMTQVQSIHYSNALQWGKFQKNLYKIQQLQLQIQVLEIMCTDIIPQMWNLEGNDPAFAALFKTCSALCDMAALTVPVLVKS